MPKEWYDRHSANAIDDPVKRKFYQSIVADKKPYFMRIIYPALMRQYNTYIKNTNKNAMREFHMTIDELMAIPEERRTDRQREFLYYYNLKMPVGVHDCVMNRICRMFEKAFDGYLGRRNVNTYFDYTILKSSAEYTQSQYNAVLKLYDAYNRRLRNYAVFANYERIDEYESFSRMEEMRTEFEQDCDEACPNRSALCNIVLDICYRKSSTKRFAWEMCGDEIIHNLLVNNDNIISFPVIDPSGDIIFCGERFSLRQKKIGGML